MEINPHKPRPCFDMALNVVFRCHVLSQRCHNGMMQSTEPELTAFKCLQKVQREPCGPSTEAGAGTELSTKAQSWHRNISGHRANQRG